MREGSLEEKEVFYYLGIDGGGTKTDFALMDKTGRVCRRITLEGCNPIDKGEKVTFRILREGICQVCAKIPFSQISVFAGIAGGETGEYQQKISEFLKSFSFARFQNGSDARNAIALGLGVKDGIVIILGTGSVAFSQVSGNIRKTGGFGYLLGDKGSGFSIGRDMLQAVLEAEEGYGEKTILQDSLLKFCGTETVLENLPLFYEGGKKMIASLAPMVFKAWEAGDLVSQRILEENMRAAAELILHAGQRMSDRKKIPVVLMGGITKQETVILPLIKRYLEQQIKNAEKYHLIVCKEPMYLGALMMAGRKRTEDGIHAEDRKAE